MGNASPQHQYRADIDGLRSLAILPVLLYHLKVSFVPGGFVGVDVFFVISGYLITQLIGQQIEQRRYSIIDFYHRRARRIFPALFFLLACCLAAAVLFLLPDEMPSFRSSMLAATLFFSNIYFQATTDYFAQAANIPPLLHTWSLAVEEQFYIFFPLILIGIHRFWPRGEKLMLAVLAALSLAISIWMTANSPTGAFYLLQSRAWELLIGGLLARDAVPAFKHRLLAEASGLAGIVLILGTSAIYSDRAPFPGLAALPPCLGAALLLHSGQHVQTLSARLLSTLPLRFVGLISYSLYLWHWPLIVFAEYLIPGEFGKGIKLAIMALSFIAAAFSWYCIEQPFRHQPYRLDRRQILGLSAAVMAGFVIFSTLLVPLSDRRWHLPEEVQQILAARTDRSPQRPATDKTTCFLTPDSDDVARFDVDHCLALASDKPNYLLVGDSHAAHLWSGLAAAYPGINLMQATASGCKPTIASAGQSRCTDLMHYIFTDFLKAHQVDAVLISARWKPYDFDDLKRTIDAIKPYAPRIIVFGPTVEYKSPLPRLLAMSLMRNDPSLMDRDRLREQREIDQQFATGLRDSGASYISVYQTICPDDHCALRDASGVPLEFDYGHFTENGSLYLAEKIKAAGEL